PPGKQKLPEKCAGIFPQITNYAVSLFRHGMAINLDAIQALMHAPVILAPGAKHSHFVAVFLEGECLFPHAAVKWNWQILNDDEYFGVHVHSISFIESGWVPAWPRFRKWPGLVKGRPARRASWPVPSAAWVFC